MYLFYGDAVLAAVLAVFITAIYILWKYISKNDDYWAERGINFAPRPSPWTMYKLFTTKPMNEVLIENREKHGKVFGAFDLPPNLALVVGEPELIKDILVKDFHVFPFRRNLKFGDEMLDSMVSGMKGEDWKRVRTIMTPAFTSKRMRTMGSIINECSKSLLKTFDQHFQEKKSIDCKSVFGAYTMDVIASAAFATKIDSHNDPENVFVRNVKKSFISFEISLTKFFLSSFLPKGLLSFLGIIDSSASNFFRSVIQNVIKERKKSGQRYNDMLQVLMDALEENRSEDVDREHKDLLEDDVDQYGTVISENEASTSKSKKLQEIELLSQCVMFFTVGYETTTSVLSYLCYCLALNPDWQEKLVKEVDESHANSKEMSYDSVRGMKVLDAVLSETLRMFPPSLVTERKSAEDYKLGSTGIPIKKGTHISVTIYSMHYDPDFFDDPYTFNPERFMTPDPRHPPYAYLPFGAGPRNCLGMRFALLEIKLCIVSILRHYRFKNAPETKIPLEFKKALPLLSVDKLPLAVEKRTDVQHFI